jgi:hypothetical protein
MKDGEDLMYWSSRYPKDLKAEAKPGAGKAANRRPGSASVREESISYSVLVNQYHIDSVSILRSYLAYLFVSPLYYNLSILIININSSLKS